MLEELLLLVWRLRLLLLLFFETDLISQWTRHSLDVDDVATILSIVSVINPQQHHCLYCTVHVYIRTPSSFLVATAVAARVR